MDDLREKSRSDVEALDYDVGAMVLEALTRSPEARAFRFQGADLTRAQLRDETQALAVRLKALDVRPGTAVVIEIEHSLELVVAMCAVQVAGGCAVPVDPDVSAERRDAILADICPTVSLRRAQTGNRQGRVSVEIDRGTPPEQAPQQSAIDPALAFIVYTSGSSGGPKGVMISKESYVRRMQQILPSIVAQDDDTDLAWTPSSFITMIDEIFLPLLSGVRTVIAEPSIRSDPRQFAALLAQEKITVFRITPSLLNLVLRTVNTETLAHVRTVICSGEAMSTELQLMVHDKLSATLLGFYGATEAPAAAYCPFDRDIAPVDTTICIAQPFVRLRVTDDDGHDVGPGETGEIWIGGCAVAEGYYGQPELTAEKFFTRQGERWFRTGDLGMRLDDERVEILGRADLSEVNIHGVRVNLPEICAAMRRLDHVSDVWVSPVEPTSGFDPILVGHCVMPDAEGFTPQVMQQELSRLLPSPAVPRFILRHDRFPLTANGKLDLQVLAREASAFAASSVKEVAGAGNEPAPATLKYTSLETEALLAVVLETAEEVLGISGVSAQDNFFAVGGNSLLAVHLALALSEKLDVELMSTLVFNTNCLADIAASIASGHFHAASALKLLRAGDRDAQPLLTINATGNYTALEPHLDGSYPVYNLNIFGLTNDLSDSLETVTLQDLATRLAAHIVEFFPTRSYRLMGYCQDGCLAVETARILQERHGASCSLLLIDTFFLEHRPTPKMMLMRALELGPKYYLGKLKGRLGHQQTPQDDFATIPLERRAVLMAKSQNDEKLYRRYTELFMTYRPTAIDCPVMLFISSEWRHANLACVRDLAGERLMVKHINGLHNTLFKPEAVSDLAKAVDVTMAQDNAPAD